METGPKVNVIRFNVDTTQITISAGDVVTWTNTDTRNHHLVSGTPDDPVRPEDGGFDTGIFAPGEMYAHRFCTPRTVMYYCAAHSGVMRDFSIVIE